MQQPSDLRGMLAGSLRENGVALIIVVLHFLFAMALAWRFQFNLRADPSFSLSMFLAWCAVFFAVPFLWVLLKERPESPIRFSTEVSRRWRLRERISLAAPILPAVAVLLPTYSSVKAAIPAITQYDLDPLFAQMDVWIHGRHAWEVLQPMLGYPLVSYSINVVYHLWMVLFYVVFSAVAVWVEQLELRRRFLIAFLLCWVLLGNVAAILLPSVGPCFYGLFYPNDPYVGLMEYLHRADQVISLPVLDIQQMLIVWSQSGDPGLGRGISAMPSMHVAIACLLMLLSWKLGRLWAWAGTLFLIAIVLGSVHLAYHYAIDAYASLIATPLIWWASKHLAAFRGFGPRLAVATVAAE